MSENVFHLALDFIERSNVQQARLLGGEPTLHPGFSGLAMQVIQRGLHLMVFSNGLMPEEALRCLMEIPEEKVSVLINATDLETIAPEENERLSWVLHSLGSRAALGLNIKSPPIPSDRLLALIETHELSRTIRLGLAHPSGRGGNQSLHPRFYSQTGQRVIAFAKLCRDRSIEISFDCGFVPCMFSDENMEYLGKAGDEIGRQCSPIPDILPTGEVIACYPLFDLCNEPLPPEKDASWLRAFFDNRLSPYRSVGVFRECSSCSWRLDDRCTGGCMAAAMQRIRSVPFAFSLVRHTRKASDSVRSLSFVSHGRVKSDEKTENREAAHSPEQWVLPYTDQPISFWEQLAGEWGNHIKEIYLPLPGKSIGSGRPSQPADFLKTLLRRRLFDFSVLINPIILPGPVPELSPGIIEELKRLRGEFGLAGATVASLELAFRIREELPELTLTASTLMDICRPNQVVLLSDVFDHLVPSSRIMRDLPALCDLREAFPKRIRLIVNEACLPGCPFRSQHFHEMASQPYPRSLCSNILEKHAWMRLTGSWVLPQHLHLYNGAYDDLKLAGRATLRDPKTYRNVLDSYIHRKPLTPDRIGGGPASVIQPIPISEEFFKRTLECRHQCQSCTLCREYYADAVEGHDLFRQQAQELAAEEKG